MRFWLKYAAYWLDRNLHRLPELLALLVLVVLYLYHIRWTYRDAEYRFNKGFYWALFVALVPAAGFVFYLFYRQSPLVEYDLEEEEFALWGSTELRRFQRAQSRRRMRERIERLRSSVESLGSRVGEKYVRPVLALFDMERHSKALSQFLSRQSEKYAPKVRKAGKRVSDALNESRSKAEKNLEFFQRLQEMPVEDERLEELIYEQNYREALEIARDNLEIAREEGESRAVNTYQRYVERLEAILERESSGGEG